MKIAFRLQTFLDIDAAGFKKALGIKMLAFRF